MHTFDNLYDDLKALVERNSNILYTLLEYLSAKGVVLPSDFMDFCSSVEIGGYKKEIYRNEEDTRSVRHNLHPGGIMSTLELCEMAGLSADVHVLDAGTGHGGAARVIAENYGCRVTGIDRDYVRLVNAIFRTRMLELDHLVRFCLEDAYAMSFENETFDVVFRQHSVYGGREESFISECRRVLKPNGVIAFHGILKQVSLGGKKMKMEDYSVEEYKKLLDSYGFKVTEIETEKSTAQLLDSLNETDPLMCGMIRKKLVTGIKLVACKEETA